MKECVWIRKLELLSGIKKDKKGGALWLNVIKLRRRTKNQ